MVGNGELAHVETHFGKKLMGSPLIDPWRRVGNVICCLPGERNHRFVVVFVVPLLN